MTKIMPGQEKEFFEKSSRKQIAEYKKFCIDVNSLDHKPTSEEIEDINKYNAQIQKEL